MQIHWNYEAGHQNNHSSDQTLYNGDEGALYKISMHVCDWAREFNHFPLVFVSINGYFFIVEIFVM